MGRLYSRDIQDKLEEIDAHIGEEYRLAHPKGERDWRTYEQQFARRVSTAMMMLGPLIREAVNAIHVERTAGHPHSLPLEDRVRLLLIKQLLSKSNRMFSNMLVMFSLLSGIDVSYKTIERLYSDELVMMAVHNLHVLLLRKRGVSESDAAGDGTGYSLTVKRNYESYARELKDLRRRTAGRAERSRGRPMTAATEDGARSTGGGSSPACSP